MSHRHHAIDYIELTVRDLQRAKRLYTQAFGWQLKDYGPSYAGIQGEEREQGGLTVGEPTRGGPLVVLFSQDLDATLAAVVDAGGTIETEPFDFPGGRRFHFEDTEGNVLGVWAEPLRG